MVEIPISRVVWEKTHRLILSHFPPIDLFDDLADPQDWEALALAESRTNPRIYEKIGDLSLVPSKRRVSGPGASWVMAAF
ncbi:MAG: RES domain-containing protein, partial [Pseudomonadota bacterium]